MFSFFLAKRFFFQTGTRDSAQSSRRVSAPTVRNATFGIAVGIAIMVLSVCIVRGYQHEISSRVVGFASHIVVMAPQASVSPEAHPVVTDEALIRQVRHVPGVVHVQRFSQKMGVLKTKDDFAGFMLKGVASDYDLRAVTKTSSSSSVSISISFFSQISSKPSKHSHSCSPRSYVWEAGKMD